MFVCSPLLYKHVEDIACLFATKTLGLSLAAKYTSSSAVAERPRDALCLSVVSLNQISVPYCTCRWNGSQHSVKPDIGSESRFLPTPPAFHAPVSGVPVGILSCRLERKKLEWLGYPMIENFEDTFIRFDTIHEREEQTHRHHITAKTAHDASIARQKS